MQTDRIRILEMLGKGELTVEEADYLLEAISINMAKQSRIDNLAPSPAANIPRRQNIKLGNYADSQNGEAI